jgi:hypothetical protein
MRGSTPTVPAPADWTWLTAALLPVLVAALLGSAAAAWADDEQSGSSSAPYWLDGRSRVEMRLGASNFWVSHDEWTDTLDVTGGDVALVLSHWVHENLTLELSLGATNVGVRSRSTPRGETVRAEGFYRAMAGGRFYLPVKGAFRPHLDLAGGLLTEIDIHDSPWHTDVSGRSARAGIEAGGGVDFLLGSHFVLGVRAAALLREGHRSQLNAGGSLGWTFGGRR